MFHHEGPAVVSAMHDLTSRVFEHLKITSPMDLDQRVAYTRSILRGAEINRYKAVLLKCNQSSNNFAGDKWALRVEGAIYIGLLDLG